MLLCAPIAGMSVGCESRAVSTVHVSLGSLPEERRSFQPKSSLAEYLELPGGGAEARVLLSSHDITCESLLPLKPDQVLLVLSFSVPPGRKLEPSSFPYAAAPGPPADEAAANSSPGLSVLPYLRIGKAGRSVPPGGQVDITEVTLDPQGAIRGTLRLEQPGSAGVAATSLLGSFSARWCRVQGAATADSP